MRAASASESEAPNVMSCQFRRRLGTLGGEAALGRCALSEADWTCGKAAVAPALFLSGFSDHSGRLGEIALESEAIAAELSKIVAPQPAERAGAARRRAVAVRRACRST